MITELRKKEAFGKSFSKRKDAEVQEKQAAEAERQEAFQKQFEEQAGMQEQVAFLEGIAKQFLAKEAAERYGRVKIAHPALAIKVAALIAQAAQTGQLQGQISDAQLRELLTRLQEGKREFRFNK